MKEKDEKLGNIAWSRTDRKIAEAIERVRDSGIFEAVQEYTEEGTEAAPTCEQEQEEERGKPPPRSPSDTALPRAVPTVEQAIKAEIRRTTGTSFAVVKLPVQPLVVPTANENHEEFDGIATPPHHASPLGHNIRQATTADHPAIGDGEPLVVRDGEDTLILSDPEGPPEEFAPNPTANRLARAVREEAERKARDHIMAKQLDLRRRAQAAGNSPEARELLEKAAALDKVLFPK